MRTTMILLAAACLTAGCHRDAGQQTTSTTTATSGTRTANQKPAAALNPGASPMKANDIDAIAAEVRQRDQRSRRTAAVQPSPPVAASTTAPAATKATRP